MAEIWSIFLVKKRKELSHFSIVMKNKVSNLWKKKLQHYTKIKMRLLWDINTIHRETKVSRFGCAYNLRKTRSMIDTSLRISAEMISERTRGMIPNLSLGLPNVAATHLGRLSVSDRSRSIVHERLWTQKLRAKKNQDKKVMLFLEAKNEARGRFAVCWRFRTGAHPLNNLYGARWRDDKEITTPSAEFHNWSS